MSQYGGAGGPPPPPPPSGGPPPLHHHHHHPHHHHQQHNYSDVGGGRLQHVTVTPRESFNDPLGVAERGKVGLPPSSSECSSNSSVEASVESNMGLVNGFKKGIRYSVKRTKMNCFTKYNFKFASDRRLITLAGRSFDSNSTSTTLRETRIDNRIERSNSTNSGKYRKLPPMLQHQDSLDDVPDLSNNNQDVSKWALTLTEFSRSIVNLAELDTYMTLVVFIKVTMF